MAPPVKAARKGEKKFVPVALSDEVALDLQAFCKAHFGAKQKDVVEEAVRWFIQAELSDEPRRRAKFLEERLNLLTERDGLSPPAPTPFRAVPQPARKDDDDANG